MIFNGLIFLSGRNKKENRKKKKEKKQQKMKWEADEDDSEDREQEEEEKTSRVMGKGTHTSYFLFRFVKMNERRDKSAKITPAPGKRVNQ